MFKLSNIMNKGKTISLGIFLVVLIVLVSAYLDDQAMDIELELRDISMYGGESQYTANIDRYYDNPTEKNRELALNDVEKMKKLVDDNRLILDVFGPKNWEMNTQKIYLYEMSLRYPSEKGYQWDFIKYNESGLIIYDSSSKDWKTGNSGVVKSIEVIKLSMDDNNILGIIKANQDIFAMKVSSMKLKFDQDKKYRDAEYNVNGMMKGETWDFKLISGREVDKYDNELYFVVVTKYN